MKIEPNSQSNSDFARLSTTTNHFQFQEFNNKKEIMSCNSKLSEIPIGTPRSSFCRPSSSRGRTGNKGSGKGKTVKLPEHTEVETVYGKESTGCNYIRGTSSTTRLPENAEAYMIKIDDPLLAPLASITDDFNNFGGGVNPLGYKGHTFTADGYGPVYMARPQNKRTMDGLTRNSSAKPKSKRPQFSLSDSLDEDETEAQDQNDVISPTASVVASTEAAGQSIEEARQPSEAVEIDLPVLGTVWPFFTTVSLETLGESVLFSDNVYLMWRILYFLLCLFSTILSIKSLGEPVFLSTSLAITYAGITAMASLRRAVQYRLVQKFGEDKDSILSLRPLSWVDVLIRQAAPIVCIVVGIIMPGIFNAGLMSHGVVEMYYRHVTFYLTVVVTLLTLFDVWIAWIPTRATYIIMMTLLNCSMTLFAAWGFHPFWTAVGTAISGASSVALGLGLHVLTNTYQLRGEEPRKDENHESSKEDQCGGEMV